ncbi:hypothetical protein E2C01_009047 [Portunus trituberculatus]|uniref:Uncharacterized protein n=1 Tax=Portunus trituberculatus TaxID=210409 RepID=A0A5B7D3W4_PORTR|nr:hypothetical protein [Portunus trituberculatus]
MTGTSFSAGITRLPILEGEISHIEIPRRHPALGLTIVGGADTPLRRGCLVSASGLFRARSANVCIRQVTIEVIFERVYHDPLHCPRDAKR